MVRRTWMGPGLIDGDGSGLVTERAAVRFSNKSSRKLVLVRTDVRGARVRYRHKQTEVGRQNAHVRLFWGPFEHFCAFGGIAAIQRSATQVRHSERPENTFRRFV